MAAGRRPAVRVERGGPVMPSLAGLADAVERLAIHGRRLAAGVPRDTGPREEITLVGGVDELPGPHREAVFHRDRDDPRPVLLDGGQMREPVDLDLRASQEFFEGRFGLRGPEIRLADESVELASDAAADGGLAAVGVTEPARTQAAEVPAELEQHHPLAHPVGLDGRDHSGGAAAVNTDVGLDGPRFDLLGRIVVTQPGNRRFGQFHGRGVGAQAEREGGCGEDREPADRAGPEAKQMRHAADHRVRKVRLSMISSTRSRKPRPGSQAARASVRSSCRSA